MMKELMEHMAKLQDDDEPTVKNRSSPYILSHLILSLALNSRMDGTILLTSHCTAGANTGTKSETLPGHRTPGKRQLLIGTCY
jgi:hypothetical protein